MSTIMMIQGFFILFFIFLIFLFAKDLFYLVKRQFELDTFPVLLKSPQKDHCFNDLSPMGIERKYMSLLQDGVVKKYEATGKCPTQIKITSLFNDMMKSSEVRLKKGATIIFFNSTVGEIPVAIDDSLPDGTFFVIE
jgi:hypothetical protein